MTDNSEATPGMVVFIFKEGDHEREEDPVPHPSGKIRDLDTIPYKAGWIRIGEDRFLVRWDQRSAELLRGRSFCKINVHPSLEGIVWVFGDLPQAQKQNA